jgi:EAL domain-containing protein (putative c-di-GMP-specific phosphodiesterase class I)
MDLQAAARRHPRAAGRVRWVIVLSLLALSYALTVALGGADVFEPLWVLVPIAFAAWRLGARGVAVALALAIALTSPPLLMDDYSSHLAQPASEWLFRSAFLAGYGALLALLFGQVRRGLHLVERERDAARARLRLEADGASIIAALEAGEMELHYQPVVRAGDSRVVAVEALVRWNHPQRGRVPPGEFVPAAEVSGAIVDLDAWVFEQACAQALAWQALGRLEVGVNLSSRTLNDERGMAAVERAIVASGLPPELLDVEITETAAIADDGVALTRLQPLTMLGVRLSLDDFGMGYAVLERLRSFPFDTLKVDRSFVDGVTGPNRGIVEAIVTMAHALGIDALAEGVEEVAQMRVLQDLGCDLLQGYVISKPLPAAQVQQLLEIQAGVRQEPVHHVSAILDEIVRITGLANAYLTRIHWDSGEQEILRSRANGPVLVPEGLRIGWSDTLCRRALEGGPQLTADVPEVFPDSRSARELGLMSYVSVPVKVGGDVVGTLCGVSRERVELPAETLRIMSAYADVVAGALQPEPLEAAPV